MKAIFKWAFAVAPLFLASCDDDKQPVINPVGSGDDIQFTIAGAPESRTQYADDWDPANNKQDIYWGNYIKENKDKIKIFCKAVDNPVAEYQVNANETTGSNVAVDLTKVGPDAMHWAAKGTTHNFYAFYPAEQAGNQLLNGTDNTIRATVATGQSPTTYRAEIGGKGSGKGSGKVTTSLAELIKNSEQNLANQTTIYGQPNMSAAIMVAHTSITEEGYGMPVPLNFSVLADVIDITINGPITPNALGGNDGLKEIAADFIQIHTVTLEAVTGEGDETVVDQSRPISGSFDLNMQDGTVNNVSGNASIQLQTSQVDASGNQTFPTLFVRSSEAGEGHFDVLRLRAFLIPGQVKDLSQLRIRVNTNCGEYTQRLNSHTLNTVSGKIYPIKLGYFRNRGIDFDFSRWIGQLDPNIYLSELSVPGTWHSSNSMYQGTVDLKAQYNAGIRAFEVHTIGGSVPYTDNTFTTPLKYVDASTLEYNEEKLKYNVGNTSTSVSGGSNSGSLIAGWTGTNKTVTQTRTVTYQQIAKFALRLYRTRNVSQANPDPAESFSDALISLAETMNSTGFMFFEFGFEKPGDISNRDVTVPLKNVTVTQTRTKTGVTLTGSGTSGNIRWNTSNVFTDDDPWVDENITNNYNDSYTYDIGEAWAVAVESCLGRLKNTTNKTTGKPVLYTTEITPNTTIKDVQGQVIVKINTNDDIKNEGLGWSGNTPALFSRWVKGSGAQPLTINLKWGTPVAPESTPETTLRWCYTELEAVGDANVLQQRKDAIAAINAEAYKNYIGGEHRTFYECAIGGYYVSQSEAGCISLAESLNSHLLTQISNPGRKLCPLGFVFMNYAIPPSGNTTMKSSELIRAIINNNAAFLLNRASDGSGTTPSSNVKENTNSSFTEGNNGLSPLK